MTRGELFDERITHSVIGAFYEVYNVLGFGFYESIYVAALARELTARGHDVEREVTVAVRYKGVEIGVHRLDMLVDDRVVIEAKASLELHRGATRQLFSCLRASRRDVGLLLHFGPEAKVRRICARAPARLCGNRMGIERINGIERMELRTEDSSAIR
jgi:GxxExxY protein